MSEQVLTTRDLLERRFASPEYVLISEVSDDSGWRSRSLDYMAINLWKSRGLAVTGIEKKSNRTDWLKELKNPSKQELHYRYCDYFYLLTDKDNVAKLEEIPDSWGWLHTKGSQIRTMKEAPKLNPESISKGFMCAMLRRAAAKDGFVHVDTLETKILEEAVKRTEIHNKELAKKADLYDQLKLEVGKFEQASGIELSNEYWVNDGKRIGEAVELLLRSGVKGYQYQIERLYDSANQLMEKIKEEKNKVEEFLKTNPGG